MSVSSVNQLRLRGHTYELSLTATADQLRLQLNDGRDADSQAWAATFPATYIEEITHKTGHFRRFPAFVQMLRTALVGGEGSGDSILDILTYADLQALKSGRKPPSASSSSGVTGGNNKRYVILTHTGHERVHYPLPLTPSEGSMAAPDQQVLLRGAIYIAPPPAAAAAASPPLLSASPPGGSAQPLLRQYDELLREKEEVQAAYERLQRDSSREVAKVRRRSEDLATELETQGEQMEALQTELLAHGGDARVVDKLRAKLQRVEERSAEEVGTLQRALAKHKKEILLLNAELSRAKREEERLRRHVRQLEA